LRAVWDSEEEARWVGDEIESLQRKGQALAETAILVRAGFQTREFEERFIQIGLPYRIIGGPRFYERQEIRDALAYLRLIHQPADDLAFERIVNVPRRGIGEANVMTLHSAKGLEFDSVFLPGWEEGVFPNQRALEESGLKALEEERRLAYVGLTRARKRASVSFAANRRIHGQWQSSIPSRFVDELPAENVEMLAEPGLMPGMAEPRDLTGWGKTEVLRQPRWSPRSGAPLIEGRAVPVRGHEVRRVGGFKSGDRIFHQKFGYGTIQRVEDNKLAIAFDKAG